MPNHRSKESAIPVPTKVFAHYETAIERDGESFHVIALTENDEAKYARTDRPGQVFAYVLNEECDGRPFADRLAALVNQSQDTGVALRSAKALIEGLLRGETRSEGDMRDVLANFAGLDLLAA